MLTWVLATAAFVAGLTGAWSPCGFSMVSTLGEHARGRVATFWACLAFVPGALVGGVVTFGALALVGSLLGGGETALAVGAALAAVAAVAELSGVRIAPQIRRQVPEHWRRRWPLPAAAAGYGVLLGLGFTTFVLTFAVWALAGVSVAVGDVGTGVAIGVAFAAGRCLPVVVLAPYAQRPLGFRATELMAERPLIYRGFRFADGLALAAVAVALAGASPAHAATKAFVDAAGDPSVAGAELAWKVPGGAGVVQGPGGTVGFPAERLAIGGGLLAVATGTTVNVTERATGTPRLTLTLPTAASAVAVSDGYVALRRATTGGEVIEVASLGDGIRQVVATVRSPAQLGRPALDGGRVVFHVAGRKESRIDTVDVVSTARRTLRRDTRSTYTDPALLGDRLLYVQTTQYEQRLVLGSLSSTSGGRELLAIAPAITADKGYSTDHGPHRPGIKRPQRLPKEGPPGTTTTLSTTALAPDAAYVTRLRERDGAVRSALLRVPL